MREPGKPLMTLRFSAVDTWFFRDARPYHQDDPGQMNIGTLFPPSTRTLVGATRSAMARRLGWDGLEAWSDALKAQIGDSEVLAPLAFRGPLVMRGETLLLPLPLNVLGSKEAGGFVPRTRLEPGPPVRCDLGAAVRLVRAREPRMGLGLAEDAWVTSEGLARVLSGGLPEAQALHRPKELFTVEPRVGVARDPLTHAVAEGMLYSTQHIRPRPGVALTLDVTGWRGEPLAGQVPLGGDGRQAFCQAASPWQLPASPVADGARTAAIYLVTPAHLSPTAFKPQTLTIPGLEGLDLVAACVNKPQRVGGWDMAKRRPVAVSTLVSPGAVLYVRGSVERIRALRQQHGQTIGDRRDWGNGLILVGVWDGPLATSTSA